MNRHLIGAALCAAMLSSAALPAWAFQESPMLTEMVKAGTLPPVEERLPTKPTVVNALEVGTYGGTWHRAYSGPGDRWGPTKLLEERVLKWAAGPDGTAQLTPGYIESYDVNDDSTEFTFTLLDGLKWSDGAPVTTEDVEFWYKDVFLNTDIVATIDPTFSPGGVPMEVSIKDARTFTVKFAQPYVYFLQILAKDSTGEPSLDRPSFLFPKHYLSQFNNHYASEDELAAAAKKFDVASWKDLWGSKGSATAWWSNPDLPVLAAWKIEKPAPAEVVSMVRNPYYWAVDQEGNQLPYIDHIDHRLYQDPQTLALMVAQGQIDAQDRGMTQPFDFYKENEARGNYHVVRWLGSAVWSMVLNMNTTDEVLHKLYADERVRHALSVGVDRDLIIELTQSGLAKPVQAAPVSGSPYYDEELAHHWTEYDPELADQLLDEAGLTERDGAGFRLRPDGKRFSLVVEGGDMAQAKTLELLAESYAEIGVELLPRIIDRTQFDTDRSNNAFDVQYMAFDRLTYVPADPRLMMGWESFANQSFVWYSTEGESGIEPAADSPFRKLYELWDTASSAPTIEAADVAMKELIRTFVEGGYVIGVHGEGTTVNVVSNRMHNVQEDLIMDDIFREVGLSRTQQYWLDQN